MTCGSYANLRLISQPVKLLLVCIFSLFCMKSATLQDVVYGRLYIHCAQEFKCLLTKSTALLVTDLHFCKRHLFHTTEEKHEFLTLRAPRFWKCYWTIRTVQKYHINEREITKSDEIVDRNVASHFFPRSKSRNMYTYTSTFSLPCKWDKVWYRMEWTVRSENLKPETNTWV